MPPGIGTTRSEVYSGEHGDNTGPSRRRTEPSMPPKRHMRMVRTRPEPRAAGPAGLIRRAVVALAGRTPRILAPTYPICLCNIAVACSRQLRSRHQAAAACRAARQTARVGEGMTCVSRRRVVRTCPRCVRMSQTHPDQADSGLAGSASSIAEDASSPAPCSLPPTSAIIQRRLIDDAAARRVDDDGAGLHPCDRLGADQALGGPRQRNDSASATIAGCSRRSVVSANSIEKPRGKFRADFVALLGVHHIEKATLSVIRCSAFGSS